MAIAAQNIEQRGTWNSMNAEYNCPDPSVHAEVEELRAKVKHLEGMLIHETRQRTQKPDFQTFVELKHGIVGTILWALQNGEISRSKAAEALAEVAHGATEVRLPNVPDAIPEDVVPLELYRRLQELEAKQ
jgi:hypothetical protein